MVADFPGGCAVGLALTELVAIFATALEDGATSGALALAVTVAGLGAMAGSIVAIGAGTIDGSGEASGATLACVPTEGGLRPNRVNTTRPMALTTMERTPTPAMMRLRFDCEREEAAVCPQDAPVLAYRFAAGAVGSG